MQSTKRARTLKDKQHRIMHILTAARDVLHISGVNQFTVDAVAQRAALSKPALYNYFSTREEILLQLYRTMIMEWMQHLSQSAVDAPASTSRTEFDALFVRSFLNDPLLIKLTPQLTPIVEQNISAQTYNAFKTETSQFTTQFAALLVKIGRADEASSMSIALGYMTILMGAVQLAAPIPFSRDDLTEKTKIFIDSLNFENNCLSALRLLRFHPAAH